MVVSANAPRARRLGLLTSAASALHGESQLDRALAWAVGAVSELAGTEWGALCLLPREGGPEWVTGPGAGPVLAFVGDPRTLPLLRPALHETKLVVVPDLRSAESDISLDHANRLIRAECLLAAPVMASDGRLLGLLLAAGARATAFDAEALDAVSALAAHVGVALENHATLARLAELEARGKEVVHALQEAVRPPAPVVLFTELGVHYVAADPSAPTGGDLYDWITLPEGDVHLAVVDVMGKGVEATKHALAVTHALRLLAVEGCRLDDIVRRADALVVAQNPDLVATVLVARYTPLTGRLLLAGAGHPPALVVSDGEVREIAAPGIPIGWPGAGSHRVVELELERSATLILYTDGLIEGSKDILRGLRDLARAALATSSYPAPSLARALVERQLADATRHDDSVALVLRRRTPPESATSLVIGPFAHRFSPSPAAVPVARHFFVDWLERVPVERAPAEELAIVASELCSNAVRHATGAPGGVAMRAWVEGDAVILEVEDDGGSLARPSPVVDDNLPDPEAEAGRGLFLVRTFTDELVSRIDHGRTTMRVVKRAIVGTRRWAATATPP